MNIKPINFSSIANFGADANKKVSAVDDFGEMLAQQIKEGEQAMQEAKELSQKAVLGNAGVDIHDAQIAGARADLHMRFMIQARNKALEAYKEIMNMPV